MVKKRLIVNLLIYNGNVVQTRQFEPTNVVGNAFTAVDFFNSWAIDEIVLLEISRTKDFTEDFINIVNELSRRCFVPLSVGGKIDNIEKVRQYFKSGADKVVVNTEGFLKPKMLTEISNEYGSQCLVCSIDTKKNSMLKSGYEVVIDNGSKSTGKDAIEWAQYVCSIGAGELLLNSIEHDGNREGYDLNLMKIFVDNCNVPVIGMGGVGKWEDFHNGLKQCDLDAVAAGNIFHYTEHSTKKAKEFLLDCGHNMRSSSFFQLKTPRIIN